MGQLVVTPEVVASKINNMKDNKNNDITNAELGLEDYVMFRKDIIGRRGGGVLLYIKDTIPAYEVQLQEKADCNEAI